MRFPVLAVALACLVVLPTARAEEDTEHPPLCEAFVFSDKAEFLFPILDVPEWRWNRRESPQDRLEYAWEVMLPAQDPEFVFGVYLAPHEGAKQQEGNLGQLLEATSWNAVRLVPNDAGGVEGVSLPKTQLAVDLEDGGVVLTLLGKETLATFFKQRPATARFNLLHPDDVYSIGCEAEILYRQERQSKPSVREEWGLPTH